MEIKAENYFQALKFYLDVPFYGWSDFIGKKPLCFKDEDISFVQFYSHSKTHYRLNIKNKDFDGYLILSGNLDKIDFGNIEINTKELSSRDNLKWFFSLFFNRNSPMVWILLYFAFLFLLVCTASHITMAYLRSGVHANEICDNGCIKVASFYVFAFGMTTAMNLGMFLISVYFLIYKLKRIREIQIIGCMFILSLVYLGQSIQGGSKLVKEMQKPNFLTYNRIIFQQGYLKNGRNIASEIKALESDKQIKQVQFSASKDFL